jgi:alpha-L-fucosidase
MPTTGTGGVAGPSSYTAAWTSVDQHPAAPEWFQDAKFGLWTHWGAFCYPAYGSEWYPRDMYSKGGGVYNHHMSTYGDPYGDFPYDKFLTGGKDKSGNTALFAPKLVADGGKWDPDAWAQLFADAGAKMAGPVAEHHDGFSLWASKVNEWNAAEKGPKMDLVALLAKAYRAKGLKFMVSTHTAYNFAGYYSTAPTVSDASLKKLYGQLGNAAESTLWLNKEKELIDTFQPDYMWHDFGMNSVADADRLNYLTYFYNKAVEWKKDVVVSYNDGYDQHPKSVIHQTERGGMASLSNTFWLSEDTLSSSTWGYTTGMRYYSGKSLVHALIDRVSKNGFLLLNTSPMADGTFPAEQQTILKTIGTWLKTYGESIYSTRAWTKCCEGPTAMGGGGMGAPAEGKSADIRFTKSKDGKILYAIFLGPPTGAMTITGLKSGGASTVTGVTLLGSSDAVTFTQDGTGLKLTLPTAASSNANGYAVKIAFSGDVPAAN